MDLSSGRQRSLYFVLLFKKIFHIFPEFALLLLSRYSAIPGGESPGNRQSMLWPVEGPGAGLDPGTALQSGALPLSHLASYRGGEIEIYSAFSVKKLY